LPEYYQLPRRQPGDPLPVNLVPDAGAGNELKPESIVEIYSRAPHVLHDTHDGRHYSIPPGASLIEYAAAAHFRERSLVPGTRNPETGKQQRYILIPELRDPIGLCFPFDLAQYTEQQARPEAIDRASLTSKAARSVTVVQTDAEMARLAGAGASFGGMKQDRGLEGNAGGDVPADMLEPDVAALVAQAADTASAAADGVTFDPIQPAAGRRRR
jgi:hypothetical protein